MSTLVPIIVGFVLTTVLGGLLATYLQRRTWDHQNEANLRETELRRASEVCHSISHLLDKRRYRMLQLFFAVRGHAQGAVPVDVLKAKLSDYDQVLYEWNDSLNGNLAVAATYFGKNGRDSLERAYDVYQKAGSELEEAYRKVLQGLQPAPLDGLSRRIWEMNAVAYNLTLFMTTQLREGTVGRQASGPVSPPQP